MNTAKALPNVHGKYGERVTLPTHEHDVQPLHPRSPLRMLTEPTCEVGSTITTNH